MPAPLIQVKELLRQIWFAIPTDRRDPKTLKETFKRAHPDRELPSRFSLTRWIREWKGAVKETAAAFLPATAAAVPMDLKDIPQALQEALGMRLLYASRGEGLDRVENAIIDLSAAIASKAPQIADMLLEVESETTKTTTGENVVNETRVQKANVARTAVAALSQLAQAMHTVTAARIMVSVAHHNFGEGDKAHAEAEAIMLAGRADTAKDITPGRGNSNGLSAHDELSAALAGTLPKDGK